MSAERGGQVGKADLVGVEAGDGVDALAGLAGVDGLAAVDADGEAGKVLDCDGLPGQGGELGVGGTGWS